HAPPVAEEVAVRHFDRRLFGTVPVGAEQERAPVVGVRRDPDVGDLACAVDIGEVECLAGLDVDARADLPARAEVTGARGTCAFCGTAATPDRAVEIFRAYRPGLQRPKVRDACEIWAGHEAH